MIPRRFFSIASALSFFSQTCSAQTITLTTHVSACSATYTSGTSTTVIQSTVTVQPTPWTDAAANGGAPFVIRLQQVDVSGYPDQDTAPYWLTANGNTTTNSSLAAVYTINEGRLATLNGSHVATNFNVVDQAFSTTDYDLPINTTFSVNNRMLNWTNPLFSNGTAQFYKLPPGLLENALILAKFLGPMEAQRSWSPVILYVEPLVNNGTGVVSSSTSSSASGTALSTVSDLLPSGGSSSVASGSGSAASSSAAAIGSSIASKLSSQLSSVSSSASSISSDASISSAVASGVMSAPSMMESMVSSSAASVLSSIVAGVSSPLAGMSSSAAGSSSSVSTSLASVSGIGPVIVPSSSTSSAIASTSSAPPQTTYSCPVNNNEMVESNMGGMYQLGCNEGLSGADTQRAGSATNLNGCMTICDQTDGCTAWTFDGTSSCYITTGASSSGITFQPSSTQGTVSGIRNVPARPGGSASASSSVSSSALMVSSSLLSASSSAPVVSSATSSAAPSVSSAGQFSSSALNAASTSSTSGTASSVAPILSSAGASSSSPAASSSTPSGASSASITSSAAGSSTVPPVSSSQPVSVATSANTISSAPSAVVSQTTYSCPSVDNQTVADGNGATYQIKCGSDTTLGGTLSGSSPDFNGCMTQCDAVYGCGGWVYTGNCYLKMPVTNGGLTFQPAAANHVAGIRNGLAYGSGPPTTTSTATAAPTGGPPKCPAMNGTTITDDRGAKYAIICARDGQGALITTTQVNGNGINGCFAACDSTPNCGAFTYSGDSTMTGGTCYLKENAGDQSDTPVADTIAQAVLVSPATIAASSSSSASITGASSAAPAASSSGGTGSAPSTGSGSAASSAPACSPPPLPSSAGSPTVVNPDGSTSTYNGLLASPTRCDFGDPIDTEEDDSYCEVDLPFNIQIYGGSSTQTFPTTNGVSNFLTYRVSKIADLLTLATYFDRWYH